MNPETVPASPALTPDQAVGREGLRPSFAGPGALAMPPRPPAVLAPFAGDTNAGTPPPRPGVAPRHLSDPSRGEKKPLAIDLCCGEGGWTRGLLAAGWDVIGVDVESFEGYPATLFRWDVRELRPEWFPPFQLVVASPPCQEFSRHDMPWTRSKNPPAPDLSIWRACKAFARAAGVPLILENVRGAQRFCGRSKACRGPFHLWGDVPALLPEITYRPKQTYGSQQRSLRAVIPFHLAHWIATAFKP
jgi:hypothetical protein